MFLTGSGNKYPKRLFCFPMKEHIYGNLNKIYEWFSFRNLNTVILRQSFHHESYSMELFILQLEITFWTTYNHFSICLCHSLFLTVSLVASAFYIYPSSGVVPVIFYSYQNSSSVVFIGGVSWVKLVREPLCVCIPLCHYSENPFLYVHNRILKLY